MIIAMQLLQGNDVDLALEHSHSPQTKQQSPKSLNEGLHPCLAASTNMHACMYQALHSIACIYVKYVTYLRANA